MKVSEPYQGQRRYSCHSISIHFTILIVAFPGCTISSASFPFYSRQIIVTFLNVSSETMESRIRPYYIVHVAPNPNQKRFNWINHINHKSFLQQNGKDIHLLFSGNSSAIVQLECWISTKDFSAGHRIWAFLS